MAVLAFHLSTQEVETEISVSLRTKDSLDYTVDSRSVTTKTVMNSLGTDQNENKVQET